MLEDCPRLLPEDFPETSGNRTVGSASLSPGSTTSGPDEASFVTHRTRRSVRSSWKMSENATWPHWMNGMSGEGKGSLREEPLRVRV
eukprot:169463-Rhodomonas_salina.1